MNWKEIADEFGPGVNVGKMRRLAEEIERLREKFNAAMILADGHATARIQLREKLTASEASRVAMVDVLKDAKSCISVCETMLSVINLDLGKKRAVQLRAEIDTVLSDQTSNALLGALKEVEIDLQKIYLFAQEFKLLWAEEISKRALTSLSRVLGSESG